MPSLTSMRRLPRLAIAVAAVAVAGIVVAVAVAANPSTDRSFTPQKADQVTNVDVLRQQIANYYGDPGKTGNFSADSNYANEASSVASNGANWLAARSKVANRAIVLDVDDTTLATWNYEIFSNWAFNPVSNGVFVTDQRFPAVPGMVDMVTRPRPRATRSSSSPAAPAQEPPTLGNLTSDGIGVDAGYPAPSQLSNGEDGLFTKPPVGSYPLSRQAGVLRTTIHATPAVPCPTIQYKSGVRAHIEDSGYEIVGNFGDQFSDLIGGFADKTFKLPNPNYFLP